MRIVCPSCRAAYEVPETLLAGGKTVRCARCGNEWTPIQVPPLPAAATPAPSFPEESPPPEEEPEGRRHIEPRLSGYRTRNIDTADDERPLPRDDEIELAPRRGGAVVGWLISLAILALLLWAAFAFRDAVISAWPPSARLYAAFGLR